MDISLKFRRFLLPPALRPFVFGWGDPQIVADMLIVMPADGSARRIDDAAGCVLQVESGCVWLTEPGDSRDHFIGAGCGHRILGAGPVVVEAHGPHVARARLSWQREV